MSSTLDYTLQHIMNDCKPTQRLYPDSVPTGTRLASPGSNYATDAAAEPNPLPPHFTTHVMLRPLAHGAEHGDTETGKKT